MVVALSPQEVQTLDDLYQRLTARYGRDQELYEHAVLARKIKHLGMALPPNMRQFLVPLGWCHTVLETFISRQQVRAMILPGEDRADETLQQISDANNLSAQLEMWRRDRLTYGRSFLSVGTRKDGRFPLIRAESPRQIEADVDVREERITAAARFYGADEKTGQTPTHAVLYMPDYTVWLQKDRGGRWAETGRDTHRQGSVPLIMDLNRRWSGSFEGLSELTEIIPLVEASTRSVTNLQFAQEAHGVPGIWATGVKTGDFLDQDGKPLSQFEAYYDVIKILSDPNAKWGQFSAADLKNFETALRMYGQQASIVTGFPAKYFGVTAVNPASEGAIIADEIQLVRSVERKNESEGVALGWAAALAYKFHTGREVEGNRIRIEHHSPATPTVAQREDALVKRRSVGVLSREGYWDELGWSEARKAKERGYLEAEEADPYLARLDAKAASPAAAEG